MVWILFYSWIKLVKWLQQSESMNHTNNKSNLLEKRLLKKKFKKKIFRLKKLKQITINSNYTKPFFKKLFVINILTGFFTSALLIFKDICYENFICWAQVRWEIFKITEKEYLTLQNCTVIFRSQIQLNLSPFCWN